MGPPPHGVRVTEPVMIEYGYNEPLMVSPSKQKASEALRDAPGIWFHTFRLSNGIVLPGRDPSERKLHHLCLPRDLTGLQVLDVGAFEGYFSFHAKQRNAAKVVAADHLVWNWPECYAKEHFETIRTVTDLAVQDVDVTVENLSERLRAKFDLVLFLGVLYHAPNMIEYLTKVRECTSGVCIIETLVDALDVDRPSAEFYPAAAVNNDASNFWGPNVAAVVGMCEKVGFSKVEFVNFWDLNTRETLSGSSYLRAVKSARAVFWAYA
jgi:tRNA (mo5U34)-methyltransferase